MAAIGDQAFICQPDISRPSRRCGDAASLQVLGNDVLTGAGLSAPVLESRFGIRIGDNGLKAAN
jgi:hypothetical protein